MPRGRTSRDRRYPAKYPVKHSAVLLTLSLRAILRDRYRGRPFAPRGGTIPKYGIPEACCIPGGVLHYSRVGKCHPSTHLEFLVSAKQVDGHAVSTAQHSEAHRLTALSHLVQGVKEGIQSS